MTHEIDLGLRGKVALVTAAAASRRYRQWAGGLHLLARAGARVGRGLNAGTPELTAAHMNEGGGLALEADVTQAEDCARMVDAAVQAWGRLLDNNVGIGPSAALSKRWRNGIVLCK